MLTVFTTLFVFIPQNLNCLSVNELSQLRCGDTINGELNSSSSIHYQPFEVLNQTTVLFDTCGSQYNASLGLYRMDFIKVSESVSGPRWDQDRTNDGECDQQAQLLHQLFPGEYILEITGFGNETNHAYGKWNINVFCIDNCTTHLGCWNNKHHFNNTIINIDSTQPITTRFDNIWPDQPGLAYWNSSICLIGLESIHYTQYMGKIGTIDDFDDWNHISYNKDSLTSWNAQFYAQYQSYLYILGGSEYGFTFSRINLNHFTIESTTIILGTYISIFQYVNCIVAHSESIHGVTDSAMIAITLPTSDWSTLIIDNQWKISSYDDHNGEGDVQTCAITNDGKYIYIFAQYDHPGNARVMKYNVDNGNMDYLSAYSPMLIDGTVIRSVTGRNGKMYINGGALQEWKTLIFNPQIEQFENVSIDINTIITEELIYYRASQITTVDDNILLMLYKTYNGFNLYSTVTDLISINFTATQKELRIWPSAGFEIEYYLNDFTKPYYNNYSVLFICNDTSIHIQTEIILDTNNDGCLCSEIIYDGHNCEQCHQHFDLKQYLSTKDNLDQLIFIYSDIGSKALLLPRQIIIPLQRCKMSINMPTTTTNSNDRTLQFRFYLSPNCYSRINQNYSFNINAPSINFSKTLTISVGDEIAMCKIYGIPSETDFVLCSENSFMIEHERIGQINETYFDVEMLSNDIDLALTSPHNNTIHYYTNKTKIYSNKDLYKLYYLLSVLLLIPCVGLIIYNRYQNYMSAFVVDKSLVLIIGICQFDEKRLLLTKVKQNVIDLQELWMNKYNYDVYVCNRETFYCTKQDIIDFVDVYKEKLMTAVYKSVIVHILSHGSNDAFLSSDLKDVSMDFIKHELITTIEETEHVEMMKLIFYHGCRGDANYTDGDVSRTNKFISLHVDVVEKVEEEKYEIKKIDSRQTKSIFVGNSMKNKQYMSADSNCLVISGTITGRTMSDSGNFTKCICDSFSNNLRKNIKKDLNAMLVEIGKDLERRTNHSEICTWNANPRHTHIRFEKCKYMNKYIQMVGYQSSNMISCQQPLLN
eukprot:472413_1